MEMGGPDAYGLPPRKMPGSILRRQVRPGALAARASRRSNDLPLAACTLCHCTKACLPCAASTPPKLISPSHSAATPPCQVADCAVEALVEPAASRKVVEIIAKQENVRRPYTELFASV